MSPRQSVVQIDEAPQQLPGRIELEGEPAFGEVDLDAVRALGEAASDLCLSFGQKVRDEGFAWIVAYPLGWIEEAERRDRDHRLLDRHMCVAQRILQERVGAHAVTKWP
jgi:hypothetical protein